MHPEKNTPPTQRSLKEWLDGLQRESWQLELVVSGFVIFLLLGGWEPLNALEHTFIIMAQNQEAFFLYDFVLDITRTAYFALLLFLLGHLILRGLWIAAIGLRSVSGEIDYDRFRFAPKFMTHIQQRTGSFDDYVIRLERWCSVFFSLAFLIVFCFLSLLSFGVLLFLLQWVASLLFGNGSMYDPSISFIIEPMMLVLGFLYLLDFVTLGGLKRVRWINRPYYYVYRVMSWVSLARLYRPLYYNLIDNGFGRRLAVATPFIIVMILVGFALKQVRYAYMPITLGQGTEWILPRVYDDEAKYQDNRLWLTTLKSRYVKNDYVEAFVPYVPINDDETLEMIDSTLEVGRYVGIKLGKPFDFSKTANPDADYPALLRAFGELRRVYVNDSLISVAPRFTNHLERRQSGVTYMIPAHDLPPGEHVLRIDKRMFRRDSVLYTTGLSIHFYK